MQDQRQRVAVIGSGISGLASAYFLQKKYDVTLYESNTYFGGHTNTVDITVDGITQPVDTGFLVFNHKTYPNLIALFAELGIDSYDTDMSFGVSVNDGQIEWAGTNLNTVFAQRTNLLSIPFINMLRDILRFNKDAEANLEASLTNKVNLGELLKNEGYGRRFQEHYLVPMAAAIWSSSPKDILEFPASTFLRFCLNHALLQVNDRPKWKTVKGGGRSYVKKILETISDKRLNTAVEKVERQQGKVAVTANGGTELFDEVVFATHAPTSLALLKDADEKERKILSQFRYQTNRAVLHTDTRLLPSNKNVWSAWNYIGTKATGPEDQAAVCVSYLLNQLQRLEIKAPVIVTLNPAVEPQPSKVLRSFDYEHPIFDQAAIDAQVALVEIQGKNKVWFTGAWSGYGFHEDGLKSALKVATAIGVAPEWMKL
ncbi:FAD-dependent oxidoreductase [Undibacterium sp. LX40W]|uniref:FAD-dependent oxidoreductase n=1 Tax=Undibacterium nitidum TaxID=2762298 RepID=A0A923HKH5_9BURK|nr:MULTISPECIES: FAD-dependent oxidoreductase [Undibacterium]MBC3880003.1 FAD-dependent oxidoreductase [Undibacterium nitidum]MBC3891261.1 FAD-dependent oxidoreductase [Undibacterium sp. LX40W]